VFRLVLCGLFLFACLIAQGDSAAAADKRVALVIGNSAYRHTPR
jgi:hypothetical protein